MSEQKPSGLRNPGAAVRGVGAGTLVLQSVVLLLALAPLARIGGEHKTAAMWFCAALVVASVVLAGLLRHDWAWWAALALPLALIAVGFGGWFISRQALAPVQRIASAAKLISTEQLDQRLPVPDRQDEIGQLTTVLNEMMDRLQTGFRQATRFTADASHELRTPLTIMRGELEQALQSTRDDPAQEKLLLNLLEETNRLAHITDGLLLLSRADANKLRLHHAELDLALMLRELLEDVEIIAAEKSISIETTLPESLPIKADADFLRQLLLNLLENALKYNEQHGWVKIHATGTKQECAVTIANSGPGIPAPESPFIFDRFYRVSHRDKGGKGHGLGLSICREIARAHGGDVKLSESRPGFTEFTFSIPAHQP